MSGLHQNRHISALWSKLGFLVQRYGSIPEEMNNWASYALEDDVNSMVCILKGTCISAQGGIQN